jgi:ASTRA-associated protein 1
MNLSGLAHKTLSSSVKADIWFLPSQVRLHAAIGQEGNKPIFDAQATADRGSAGIIMALHLYLTPTPEENSDAQSLTGSETPTTCLRLICAYENGSVVLRKYTRSSEPKSIEGRGWDTVWKHKGHVETSTCLSFLCQALFRLKSLQLWQCLSHATTVSL